MHKQTHKRAFYTLAGCIAALDKALRETTVAFLVEYLK